MAGSLTYRAYTADDGQVYAVRVDESNANGSVSGGSGALLPVRSADVPQLPKSLKMRYFLARSTANPNIRRKFYVGSGSNAVAGQTPGSTITAEAYPGANDTGGTSVTYTITAYRGEKRNLIPAVGSPDTGLTDGTAGQ